MTDSYYGMRALMEPEGWPVAQTTGRDREGECNQSLEDEDIQERLETYRKLAEKNIPLTTE